MSTADDELSARVRAAVELIEELGGDLREARGARRGAADPARRRRRGSCRGRTATAARRSARCSMRARVAARREADRAVLDQTGIRALRREPVFRTPLPMPDQALDAPVRDDEGGEDPWAAAEARARATSAPRSASRTRALCYVCKRDFHELHLFYDQMCPPCAELNYGKRDADRGSARPRRARHRRARQDRLPGGDQAAARGRRGDRRDAVPARRRAPVRARARRRATGRRGCTSTASICATRRASSCSRAHLLATQPRLDVLINNACQTVRRPSGWYDHVRRRRGRAARRAFERAVLERNRALRGELPAVSGGRAARAATGGRDPRDRAVEVGGAVAGAAARRGSRARRRTVSRRAGSIRTCSRSTCATSTAGG